jgi:hypothetical protein
MFTGVARTNNLLPAAVINLMRIRLICVLFLQAGFTISAQTSRLEQLMAIRPEIVGELGTDKLPAGTHLLHMDFAGASFVRSADFRNLSADSIIGIKLVYTRFKELERFDQPELNRRRFEALEKRLPGILKQPGIRWEILEQRNAITRENAARCFHGFVVMTSRVVPSAETAVEISKMEYVLSLMKDTQYQVPLRIDYKIKKRRVSTGFYLPRNKAKLDLGIRYEHKSLWFRKQEVKLVKDSIERGRSGGFEVHTKTFDPKSLPDTMVLHTLNQIRSLKKYALVQDVTGSMSPYTIQVLIWLQMKPHLMQEGRFLFFNDGDNMPDEWKLPGKTGGLYLVQHTGFDTLKSVLYRSMGKGTGGDLAENNVEAILKAIEVYPEADTILMFGDNQAPVKDIRLISKVNRPVNVLLCGIQNTINPQMVEIVKRTGGKLMFPGGVWFDPQRARDGQLLTLGNRVFEYKNQKFTLSYVKRGMR